MLPDGRYDVFIVDVQEVGTEDGDARPSPASLLLDLTVVSGEHKGEVVSVRATGLARDPLDLIGLPATMTVADGRPSIAVDA